MATNGPTSIEAVSNCTRPFTVVVLVPCSCTTDSMSTRNGAVPLKGPSSCSEAEPDVRSSSETIRKACPDRDMLAESVSTTSSETIKEAFPDMDKLAESVSTKLLKGKSCSLLNTAAALFCSEKRSGQPEQLVAVPNHDTMGKEVQTNKKPHEGASKQ